jgi:hypothetical protein
VPIHLLDQSGVPILGPAGPGSALLAQDSPRPVAYSQIWPFLSSAQAPAAIPLQTAYSQVWPFLFSALPPAPPFVAADFAEAIGHALEADPWLVSLLGGMAVPKVWTPAAPNTFRGSRVLPPWLTFLIATPSARRVARDTYTPEGTIRLTGYAATRPAAGAIADRASLALVTARDSGAVRWSGGRLMDLWPANGPATPMPAPAAISGRLFAETRTYAFKYQGPIS